MTTQQDILTPIIDDFINKILQFNNSFVIRTRKGSYLQFKHENVNEIKQKLADKNNEGLRVIIADPFSSLELIEDQFSSSVCPKSYTKHFSIVIICLIIIIIFLIFKLIRKK